MNIIVATSILEEGLDVQSCNLIIRFDPSATVCSFIQSCGHARMQNSDFLLMLKRCDLIFCPSSVKYHAPDCLHSSNVCLNNFLWTSI